MPQDPLKHLSKVGRSVGSGGGDGWGRYAGLGVQFAGTLGVFAWLGWYLDRKLDSSPWCLLLGVGLGFAGALVSLVRAVPPAAGSRNTGAGRSASTERPSDPQDTNDPPTPSP